MELINDYKRRLDTVNKMISEFRSNGSINDTRKDERLKTKASEYRTIIAELERAGASFAEELIDAINDIQQGGINTTGVNIPNDEWFSDEQFDIIRRLSKIK
jgi:hypothetical protein